jgi:hypothetical protein
MKRLVAVVVAAAFFAGVAVASLQRGGLDRPLVLRGGASPSPLLGLTYGRLDTWLTRLDPKSLRVASGRWLALDRYSSGWSFSPDRQLLAFGSQPSALNDSPAGIRLVDARSLRKVRDVPLDVTGFVTATHWTAADRLLAVVSGCCSQGDSVAVIDPVAGRVVQRHQLGGTVAAIGRARGALVLLVEGTGYGPVRLVVADGAGTQRSLTLARIEAGVRETPPPDSLLRADRAGLAVDAQRGRAYVVAAGDPVADVNLTTLAVDYRTPAQRVSLLGRLHDWLEPRAQAKGPMEGSTRYAVWLGDGRLAVYGRDGAPRLDADGRLEAEVHPSGLQVIDTHSWSARVVDPRSSSLVVAGNALLSWGLSWDSGKNRETGTGLGIYGPTGLRRFHLFGPRPIYDVQVVGSRAFVRKANALPRYSIVNLRTGKQLTTIRGREMPLVLSGAGSAFAG